MGRRKRKSLARNGKKEKKSLARNGKKKRKSLARNGKSLKKKSYYLRECVLYVLSSLILLNMVSV